MDIKDFMDNHLQRISDAGLWAVAAFALVTVIAMVVIIVISIRDGDSKKRTAVTALGFGFIASVFNVLCLGVVITVIATVMVDDSSDELAAMVNDYYGVEISAQKIAEAWNAGNEDVILAGTVHDGERKSLGININEDTDIVTVYEGNVALEPAAN